jgi:hypothetical protein
MMTLTAEFIAKSAIGRDEKVLADLEEASVVAVAVEETGTNTDTKQKTILLRRDCFLFARI